MKWLSALLLTLLIMGAGSTLSAQPRPAAMRQLDGYSLDPKTELHKGVNFRVVTKLKDFEKLFGLQRIHHADLPDFSKETVLVMALPPANKDADLSFLDALTAANFMEIHVQIDRKKYPLTYQTHPIAVVAIPKVKDITTYRFYEGARLLETITSK